MQGRVLRALIVGLVLWWMEAGTGFAARPFIMHDDLVQHQLKSQGIDLDRLWNEMVEAAFTSDEKDLLHDEIVNTRAIANPLQRKKLQQGLEALYRRIAAGRPYSDPELCRHLLEYFSWNAISLRIALGDPHVLTRPTTPIAGELKGAITRYSNFASYNQNDPSFAHFWQHRAPAPPPPPPSWASRMASYFVCYLVLSSMVTIPACNFFCK